MKSGGMRVALVTEGTYPLHAGGVAAWCDQLVRGLPDVRFEVVALSGSGREPFAYTPPGNVAGVRRVGLWARVPRGRPFGRTTTLRFVGAYAQMFEAVLRGGPRAAEWFETALRDLRDLARRGSLTGALRSQLAVDVLLDVWSRTPVPGAPTDVAMTLADALAVTDLVEHFLRPLQLPAVRADLVHATANGPGMLVGLTAKWSAGTPVLLSEHGVYLRERLLAVRRDGYPRTVRTVLVRFFHRLCELGYRGADAVLPVSAFNGRWAVRGGADPERVRLLPNGVDPAGLPFLDDEPDVPTLVFAGRIDPLKDLETLLRAFALVRAQVPNARLRLYGGVPAGNEAYDAEIRRLVEELDLEGCATFEGPVSPVTKAFAAGHVVVQSSRSEGLPLTIIEAAISGRPTVVTDVGGMSEAAGRGGLVVPPGDPGAFAAACVRLLTDDGERRRLAAAGREDALARFTLARFLDDLRGLYTEVAPEQPPARRGRWAVPRQRTEPTAPDTAVTDPAPTDPAVREKVR
jgi:glycosyltransferase involved in cell wall biosynthesis